MVFAQENSTGIFQYNRDIGSPKIAGSVAYDHASQTYTIEGAGNSDLEKPDAFRFLYNKLKGDFIATANFEFENAQDMHQKMGWMARATVADKALMVGSFLYGDGHMTAEWTEPVEKEIQNSPEKISASKRYQ